MQNIVLIGFMGVGKGQVARKLSKTTGLFNLDTDDLIQSSLNLKINKIFKYFGEPAFRKMEKNLGAFLEKNVQNAIISTGGGFYKVPNLNKIGKVFYLRNDFDSIIEKLESSKNSKKKFKKRPLLKDKKRARKIFLRRKSKYEEKADFIINVKNKNPKQIAEEIKEILNNLKEEN